MPKIKSQKSDAEDSIRLGLTIEQASHRRVFIEGLSTLFKKDVLQGPVYTVDLLRKLHIEHLGFDPTADDKEE